MTVIYFSGVYFTLILLGYLLETSNFRKYFFNILKEFPYKYKYLNFVKNKLSFNMYFAIFIMIISMFSWISFLILLFTYLQIKNKK